jgi:outer membrane receptor for ferrienterochelin and colicins
MRSVRVLLGTALMMLAGYSAAAQEERTSGAKFMELSLEELMNEPIDALAKRVNVRERSELAAPVLSYSEEFFQRFEPLSVGEMLKRTPGVTFASDVGEYAEPSLRGAGPQYTQVLINGRRISGSGNDRTVLVDRIPAELVERVEIIRSPSADIDSQGLAGSLNIVLKDGAAFEGGIYRAGGYYIDGESRPSTFLSYGNASETMRWGASLNYQERFNHKQVFAVERSSGGDGAPMPEFSTKIEPDQRETQDTALVSDLAFVLGGGQELSFDALFIDTDRQEKQFERTFEFADEDGALERDATQNNQTESIKERNWLISAKFSAPLAHGRSYELSASHDRTDAENLQADYAVDLVDFDFGAVGLADGSDVLRFLSSQSDREIKDRFVFSSRPFGREINVFDNIDSVQSERISDFETKAGGRFSWQFDVSSLTIGLEYVNKTRDWATQVSEPEGGALALVDAASGELTADEDDVNAFAQWSAAFGNKHLELGVRAEHTSLELASTVSPSIAGALEMAALGLNVDEQQIVTRADELQVNPLAHLRWDVSERLRLRLSGAQTVRRPAFDELNPTLLIDGDQSVLGNPDLRQESALGLDGGMDLTLDEEHAILGFNAFYRRIDGKIELRGVSDEVNAILQSEVDEGIEAMQYVNNSHRGTIYGAELDVSYPLSVLDAPNFHVFANYTYMHSRIRDASDDFPVRRRFALQPDYHYNIGFDHLIEPWRFTWGASYQKRGAAEEWGSAGVGAREVANVTFGGNLEAFIEKTFADRFVMRLAAQNLLDAVRKDVTRTYESIDDYRRDVSASTELDQEESDPWVLFTFRGTF